MPKRTVIIIATLGILLLAGTTGYSLFFAPRTKGVSCLAEAAQKGIAPTVQEKVARRSVFLSREQCEHNTDRACGQLSIELPDKQETAGSPYAGYDWVPLDYIASERKIGKYAALINSGQCRQVREFREDPDPQAKDDERVEVIYVCSDDNLFLIEQFIANLQGLFVFDRNPCGLDTGA